VGHDPYIRDVLIASKTSRVVSLDDYEEFLQDLELVIGHRTLVSERLVE
jgi:hypothetical protein